MSRLQSMIDRFVTRAWPSTQGSLDFKIYADLVTYLYTCRSTIVMGAIGAGLIMTFVAFHDELWSLTIYTALIYVPVSVARLIHVDRFMRTPLDERLGIIRIHEARYVFMTMGNTGSLAVMSTIIMLWGSMESKLAVSSVIIGIATGIAGRNASTPKLVRLQIATLITPLILGLFATLHPIAMLVSVLFVMFFRSMGETSQRLQRDTIEAREHAFRADRMARFDSLTGLPNRYHFNATLDERVRRGESLSVLYLDLDQFKKLNDTQGHPAGDALLCSVADRIKAIADPKLTTIARFGGDEFVIMTSENPEQLATAILEVLREPFHLQTGTALIGCSIGIALPHGDFSAVDLIKHADLALYKAKETGRNRFVVFEDAMREVSSRRALMEERLRLALAGNAIQVHYQPIVDLHSHRIVAAEALVRWNDEVLGQVRPDIFVALAEDVGLIDDLGECVLNQACNAAAKWSKDISVAVNISALQFRDPARLERAVEQALAQSGLKGHRLELEITEGTMIHDFEAVSATMTKMRERGVRIALDDFGSGYCSLNYLERIPFDKIKIDQSLVRKAQSNETQAIMIRMVGQIGRIRNAIVVAEGVETEGQALYVRQLGAGYAQGYLFGRPSADQSRLLPQEAAIAA